MRGARVGAAALLFVALVAVTLMLTGCGGSPPAPPAIALTSAASNANPAAPVTVAASGGELTTVRMTNTGGGAEVKGALSADRRGWRSTEDLGYGNTYRVDAAARGADGKQTTRSFTVRTVSPAGQASAEFIPAPEAVADVGVGVGQPLVVQFTRPVRNRAEAQSHLHVTSTPAQPGAWFWMDDEHVHYRPERFWQPGTVIQLDARIYGVDLGDGVYGSADHQATYRVHDSWIAEADGDTDQMAIYHNGQLVNTMPISMGKDATPTHSGAHVISDKDQTVRMNSCSFGVCSGPRAYNVTEHWAERISNDGEFVHQNPDSVSAQGSTNVSHGCINLNEANAKWFFQHLGLGDVVQVTNSGGPPLPIWDTYGDWSVSWAQWLAGTPPSGSS
jgi:lipoprotein-anchoring transpeptidase ErfK/SrfK